MDETTPIKKGDYQAPLPTDLRSPCPIINALANHGYLPRDGRHVLDEDFANALAQIGVAPALSYALRSAIYLEHKPDGDTTPDTRLLGKFAIRDPGQVDSNRKPYLDLNQLARPG